MAGPSEFLQFTISISSAVKCQFIFGHIFSCITLSSMETSAIFCTKCAKRSIWFLYKSLCFLWIVQLDPTGSGSHPAPDVMMKVC